MKEIQVRQKITVNEDKEKDFDKIFMDVDEEIDL